MTEWDVGLVAGPVAIALTVAGLVVTVCVAVVTRSWDPAVRVLLDVLLAAALLGLGATDSWTSIAAVAALVAVRALWLLGARREQVGLEHP